MIIKQLVPKKELLCRVQPLQGNCYLLMPVCAVIAFALGIEYSGIFMFRSLPFLKADNPIPPTS